MNNEERAILSQDSLTFNREKNRFTLLSLLTPSIRITFPLHR